MEQLLKVGEKTKGGQIDVERELSDFEKRLQFTQQPKIEFEDGKSDRHSSCDGLKFKKILFSQSKTTLLR